MKDNISGGALTETTLLVLLGFLNINYGYGIRQWIKNITENRVVLGMGTLYGSINILIEKGWLEEYYKEGKRVFYKISEEGLRQILKEIKRMEMLLRIAKKHINNID